MMLWLQLKRTWAMATVTAAKVGFARAAMRPVTVVPILASSMKGKMRFNFTAPAPAIGTIKLVVTELDWTMMVEIMPLSHATKSFRKKTVEKRPSSRVSTAPLRFFTRKMRAVKRTNQEVVGTLVLVAVPTTMTTTIRSGERSGGAGRGAAADVST